MNWYIVNKKYVSYLNQFDQRVSYMDYGDRIKLHIGIILNVHNFNYYVPISSPKPKHRRMSNSKEFHKIQTDEGVLLSVINLNNMIPVPDTDTEQLFYDHISKYRHFDTMRDKNNYVYLLQREKIIIDSIEPILKSKAEKLYEYCKNKPYSALTKRCCDFLLLEEKCLEWADSKKEAV